MSSGTGGLTEPLSPTFLSVKRLELMNLLFTTTVIVTRKFSIEPVVGIPLTSESFAFVGLRIPYRLSKKQNIMRRTKVSFVLLGVVLWQLAACAAFQNGYEIFPNTGQTTRHTLKQLRDLHVVKQQLDYSCGSAAMATLMRYYFGERTSEQAILDKLFAPLNEKQRKIKAKRGFSLLDLRNVAQSMGYEAAGFKLPATTILYLSAPVIVHLEKDISISPCYAA